MTCYTYNGITLSEEDLFNKIRDELSTNKDLQKLAAVIYKLDNPESLLNNLRSEGKKAQKKQEESSKDKHPYISVTNFITARHTHLGNKRLTPEFQEDARELNFVNTHLSEYNGDKEAAIADFRELIAQEKLNSQVGSHIHNLVSILLEHGRNSEEYKTAVNQDLHNALAENNYALAKVVTVEDLILKNKSEIEKVRAAESYITNTAYDVYTWIKKQWGDCKIYSELPMLLKSSKHSYIDCIVDKVNGNRPVNYEGILGIADLVVLDKNNKIHIVDYKVCSRPYNEWYLAKLNEVDYQLAIYRAILVEAGFNGDDINLWIKPILFEKLRISTLNANQEEINALSAKYNGASRLSWRLGTFTAELRKLGIGTAISVVPLDYSELRNKIEKDRSKVIGDYDDPKILTKLFFIDHDRIEPDKDSTGKIIGYKFWSRLAGTHGDYLRAKTREEFEKPGGIIDQYINLLEASRNEIGITLIKEIKKYRTNIEDGTQKGILEFLRSGNNANRKLILYKTLGKYTSPEWSCLSDEDNFPSEILDKGIIIFQKTDVKTGEKILDIVVLAESPLTQNVLINGNLTVLGKFKTDEEVKQLKIVPLKSQYRNVKAFEAAVVLNSLLDINPDIFNRASLGNFVVLNPNGQVSDNEGINVKQLLDNFDVVCSKENGNMINHLRKMRHMDTYEYCMSELQTILNNLGEEDKDLKKILSDIDNGTESLRVKKLTIDRLLRAMRNHYPSVRSFGIEGNDHIDLDKPEQVVYIILSLMNNYLHGVRIDFDGRIPRYAISVSELFSLLGVPFLGRQAQTDSEGDSIVGFGNGMELSSPRATRSNTLRQLYAYYDVVYNNVRREFTKQTNFVSNLTKNYVKNFGTHSLIESENLKIWERLLVHDGNLINPLLLVKNPYDMSNDLTELDRDFLKLWLWEVNKYLINDPNLSTEWYYKDHESEIKNSEIFKDIAGNNDGKYFLLPLARSDSFLRAVRLKAFGLKKWFEAKWKDFEETYDPRQLHNERKKLIKDKDVVEMYNIYDIGTADRKALIDSVHSPYEFSLDFDFLALDVAFHTIRKKHFDSALLLTETVMTMMLFEHQTTGASIEDEKEVVRTLLQILKGESTLTHELKKIAKPLGVLKHVTSIAMLAARPLQFLKELTFGMFTNFSRAWSLKLGDSSNAVSIGSVTKANSILWGLRIKKYGNAILGYGMLSDFYLCEQINRLYGIANEDLMRTSQNASMSRVGVLNNMSRYMYLAQSAPDYYNRLTLFIAKMIEDGCFDAHTLNSDGELVYDWKKDKRFSELAKHGLNSNYSSSEYNRQKALYVKMCSEFEKGDDDLITWDSEKRKYVYGDILQAYTSDLKASIKEVADMAYGFYDHESKSLINHKFLGLFFLQFQTFLSAKYNLWLKGSTTRGRNTAQGKFVEMERNGIKYYDRHKIDSDTGKLLGVEAVPETELTEEEKRTLLPTIEWVGDFTEGLMYSILYTIRDVCTLNWKEIASNKQRLANVMLAFHDIILGILIVELLKALFSNTGKLQDVQPLLRVFLRGMLDIGPQALTLVSITPAFVRTWTNIKNDGIKLLSGSDTALDSIMKHFGSTRDFIWDED